IQGVEDGATIVKAWAEDFEGVPRGGLAGEGSDIVALAAVGLVVEGAAAGEENRVDTRVERAGDARDEGAHGIADDGDAFGVDLRALREVADGLHDVDLHEAGEALAGVVFVYSLGRGDDIVVRTGAGLAVDV